jgi:hypothetical protein
VLALPQYVVVGVFVGWGGWAWESSSNGDDWGGGNSWGFWGLIPTLVVFAGVALLFTTRYPRGIFGFVMGMNRWVLRVCAYATLMTDVYPPFRLDQGGTEPVGAAVAAEPPPAT